VTRRARRTPEHKEFALAESRDVGERLALLMGEAPVKAFFDDTQKQLVSQITAMAGGDGELLRIAGLKLQVFLSFKQALMVAAQQGKAAETQLARMKTDG
jgi:hypothetical protein